MNASDQSVMQTAAATASSIATELSNTAHEAGELAKASCRLADRAVRRHPWQAAGVALGVGFVLGLLVRSR